MIYILIFALGALFGAALWGYVDWTCIRRRKMSHRLKCVANEIAELNRKLDAGEPWRGYRLVREDTPDGPLHVREEIELVQDGSRE